MAERILLGSWLGALLAGCTLLTEPTSEERSRPPTATPNSARDVSAQPDPGATREATALPRQPAGPSGDPGRAGEKAPSGGPGNVSHILVSYAGATRSRVTRSKEEARQRARELLERLRNGADLGSLALEFSDDSTSRLNRGSLGVPAGTWVEPFARAATALQPGAISDLVETSFGFHIIKRDQ